MAISKEHSFILNFLIILNVHTDSSEKYLAESESNLLDPEVDRKLASILGLKDLFKVDRSESTSETSNNNTNKAENRMLLVLISSL